MSMPIGFRNFILRCILLWKVNNFPAYGLVSEQQVKGYKRCPVCGKDTDVEYIACLKKMVYLGSRRWLPLDHAFKRTRAAFNGHPELHLAPIRRSGEEIRIMAKERKAFLARGGIEDAKDDPMKEHGVKRLTALDVLPY